MQMNTIEVYDPPMCCSTGVCGPEVDPALARFAGLLEQAKSKGCVVNRFNLTQEPISFLQNETVKSLLQQKGVESLPLIFINGQLKATGTYPAATDLNSWLELEAT
jgi:hypothetical protein